MDARQLESVFIKDVILLAAACSGEHTEWNTVQALVNGKIVNSYNVDDKILKVRSSAHHELLNMYALRHALLLVMLPPRSRSLPLSRGFDTNFRRLPGHPAVTVCRCVRTSSNCPALCVYRVCRTCSLDIAHCALKALSPAPVSLNSLFSTAQKL